MKFLREFLKFLKHLGNFQHISEILNKFQQFSTHFKHFWIFNLKTRKEVRHKNFSYQTQFFFQFEFCWKIWDTSTYCSMVRKICSAIAILKLKKKNLFRIGILHVQMIDFTYALNACKCKMYVKYKMDLTKWKNNPNDDNIW